jgi:hypothetical protein
MSPLLPPLYLFSLSINLPCLWKPDTEPYAKPQKSIPLLHTHFLIFNFNIILRGI